MTNPTPDTHDHCELCGRVVDRFFECPDGYTPCCNELIAPAGDHSRCAH